MSPLFFLIFNVVLLALDAVVTFAVRASETIHVPIAGLVGVFAALMTIQFSRKWLKRQGFGLLAATASSVIVLVNYGLFALILMRNPMLQWPAVFLATSLAALLLGGLGYRRALGKLRSDV